jgi:hypothetical protein
VADETVGENFCTVVGCGRGLGCAGEIFGAGGGGLYAGVTAGGGGFSAHPASNTAATQASREKTRFILCQMRRGGWHFGNGFLGFLPEI